MELAGLIIGGVSLTALVSTTLGFCEYVRFGKSFGEDYETALTKLNIIKLRLSRWAEAVQQENRAFGSPSEGNLALATLERIKRHFEEAEKLSKKYLLRGTNTALFDLNRETTKEVKKFVDVIGKVVAQRQKKASAFQKTVWAVYDKERFSKLLSDVSGLVDDLVGLFPAEKYPGFDKNQLSLYEQDMRTLCSEDPRAVELMKSASKDLDKRLYTITMEVKVTPRHVFIGNQVKGRAIAKFGDDFMLGYSPSGLGRGHIFQGNTVDGDAVIHYGDTFGGSVTTLQIRSATI